MPRLRGIAVMRCCYGCSCGGDKGESARSVEVPRELPHEVCEVDNHQDASILVVFMVYFRGLVLVRSVLLRSYSEAFQAE